MALNERTETGKRVLKTGRRMTLILGRRHWITPTTRTTAHSVRKQTYMLFAVAASSFGYGSAPVSIAKVM